MRNMILALTVSLFLGQTASAKSINLLLYGLGSELDILFSVSNHVMIGPSLRNHSYPGKELSGSGPMFGLRSFISPKGVFEDGFYFPLFVQRGDLKVKEKTTSGSETNFAGTLTVLSYGGGIAYQWMWDTFNIQLGYVMRINDNPNHVTLNDESGSSIQVQTEELGYGNIEWALGLAF